MTSEKCFSKWIREAGRGHVVFFLSWGVLAAYGLMAAAQLTLDTNYNFFGVGSMELIWISEGLGLALGLIGFFYLFQPKKLDFYYSLPVKKSTVFWSRYVHGLIHFMIPMVIVLTACGLYQSMVDAQFTAYAAGYTGTAILCSALIFLIFYHIAVLSVVLCGKIIPAVLTCLFLIFGGAVLSGNILPAYAENYFHTYYRIPLFEDLAVFLDPMALGGALGGSRYYEKQDLMVFFPEMKHLMAGVLWIILCFIMIALVRKRRRTEGTGKIFALSAVERTAQWILSAFAGAWMGSFVTDLMENSERGTGAALTGTAALLSVLIAAGAVHILFQGICCGVSGIRQNVFRRKWQMLSSCGAAGLTLLVFLAGAPAYDGYLPEEGDVQNVAVSIDGLGMNYNYYSGIALEGGRMETDDQLERYVLTGEAKAAGNAWIASLIRTGDTGSGTYTNAVVCWHLQDGREKYRIYPVSRDDLMSFSSVYETEEYKNIAYPGVNLENTADARFTWNDGVTEQVLKLSGDEKDGLVAAYREDVYDMQMERLTEALPLGFVDVDTETAMDSGQLVIYPFFERSCRLLEKYGVQTDKTIADYPVTSVEVRTVVPVNGDGAGTSAGSAGSGVSGGVSMHWYETPEEIEPWKKKMVPVQLDLQPLLYPLDYSGDVRASVTDERSNSTVTVRCYTMIE